MIKKIIKFLSNISFFTPFILVILPILDKYHNLQSFFNFTEIIRPSIILLLIISGVFLIILRITKNRLTTVLSTNAFAIFFYSYGTISTTVKNVFPNLPSINNNIITISISILFLAFIILLISKNKNKENLSAVFTFICVGMLAYISYSIVVLQIDSNKFKVSQKKIIAKQLEEFGFNTKANKPDIYFIVMDGHAREDIAKNTLGNEKMAKFTKSLEDLGFMVQDKSQNNYSHTLLSLYSTLNMRYIDTDELNIDPEKNQMAEVINKIENNQVMDYLQALGYKTVNFRSYTWGTDTSKADYVYSKPSEVSQFESMLIGDTMAHFIFGNNPTGGNIFKGSRQVNRIQYTLNNLHRAASIDDSTYTFAHLVCPHPPFIFDENGPINQEKVLEITDGKSENYQTDYNNQMNYLDGQLVTTIKNILSSSKEEPIIILVSDHGPMSTFNWAESSPSAESYKERMSNLNAVYLPKDIKDKINYPDNVNLVNTFRSIFNATFDSKMQILENKILFSGWNKKYQFTDVTDITK